MGNQDYSAQDHGIMKWAFGGVLSGSIIFAAPASANSILRIDTSKPEGGHVSTFGNITGNEMFKFRGAVMVGKCIYFVPAEANEVYKSLVSKVLVNV